MPATLRSLADSRSALGPAPETRFGGTVSAHRVLDGVFLDLDELKRIRKSVDGATINDVALAVFGGAMRMYLDDVGELPHAPLRAMTPVALKSPTGSGIGNNVSAHVVTLATDVADPSSGWPGSPPRRVPPRRPRRRSARRTSATRSP